MLPQRGYPPKRVDDASWHDVCIASSILDSLAQCLGCTPTLLDNLVPFSSLELSCDGRSARAKVSGNFLHPLESQHFCKSPTNGFQRVVQRLAETPLVGRHKPTFCGLGLCSTPQPGFSKPPRAYRLFERLGRVALNLQPSELMCLGCSPCLVTVGMTRRWQNIGPSRVSANMRLLSMYAATLLPCASACFDVRVPSARY